MKIVAMTTFLLMKSDDDKASNESKNENLYDSSKKTHEFDEKKIKFFLIIRKTLKWIKIDRQIRHSTNMW